jgi:hypothetical protein
MLYTQMCTVAMRGVGGFIELGKGTSASVAR